MKMKSDESGLLVFLSSQLSALVLSELWAKKRTERKEGGGGVLSLLRGFSCADWTHDVGLRVVVRGGLKHTWKCLQADMKARFTQKEGGIKVLWSLTGSLQAERNKRT